MLRVMAGREALVERYRHFAGESHGRSPLYEQLAHGVAEDDDLLELFSTLPAGKQQPNLLFAAVQYVAGICQTPQGLATFKRFVVGHADDVFDVIARRRTQTNEPGRCATLLPAFGLVGQPLALIEVGAAAGLCLQPDRYGYGYDDGHIRGHTSSPVVIRCLLHGRRPTLPHTLDVAWRAGVDLAPVDVTDDDQVRWLEACVWPDQPDRLARLRAAVNVARTDPPRVVEGDLVDTLPSLASSAPQDMCLCVFHSAVLGYLDPADRRRFVEVLHDIAEHRALVWISNEAPGVVPPFDRLVPTGADETAFMLTLSTFSRLGRRDNLLATADPHGAWLDWRLSPDAPMP
jgi:hypothetical protein